MTECLSTHGGSGYAPGSYWDGDDIICGACGARIKNPRPTGSTEVKGKTAPKWPGWISKKKPGQ